MRPDPGRSVDPIRLPGSSRVSDHPSSNFGRGARRTSETTPASLLFRQEVARDTSGNPLTQY
jgi:hypothetical protein